MRAGGQVVAPLPGRIVAVHVQPGDKVRAEQPLLVLEAMKMEHSVRAPAQGVVAAVRCQVDDSGFRMASTCSPSSSRSERRSSGGPDV